MPATEDRTIAARVPVDLRADLEELARRRTDGELTPVIRAALREYVDRELGRPAHGGAGLFAELGNGNAPAPAVPPRVTTPDHVGPLTPLHLAQAWLREHVEEGASCPCCTQYARVYRRKLPSAAARVMVALYRRRDGDRYLNLPEVLDGLGRLGQVGGYRTLGHYWGLIEAMPGEREDGSKSQGWWRLTDLGIRFVERRATVPMYARVYDGRVLGLDGPPIDVVAALGHHFDYRELMAA